MRNGLRTLVLWTLLSGAAAALAWVWVEAGSPVTTLHNPTETAFATVTEVDGSLRWLALVVAGVAAVGYIGARRMDA